MKIRLLVRVDASAVTRLISRLFSSHGWYRKIDDQPTGGVTGLRLSCINRLSFSRYARHHQNEYFDDALFSRTRKPNPSWAHYETREGGSEFKSPHLNRASCQRLSISYKEIDGAGQRFFLHSSATGYLPGIQWPIS